MSTPRFAPIKPGDIFPLWQFGYKTVPSCEESFFKTMIGRGRTEEEAWHQVQTLYHSFQEPDKVCLLGTVSIEQRRRYSEKHSGFDWLRTAPIWLQNAPKSSVKDEPVIVHHPAGNNPNSFTPNQVRQLCGGQFPHETGFDWSRVTEFRLIDGVLEPYDTKGILPGPGIRLVATVVPVFV